MIPFQSLYEAISKRLQTEVPDLNYIDLDWGQMEGYGDRPPVSFPAVLISFDTFTYTDASDNIQLAEGTVSIRLCADTHSNTSHKTPEQYRAKALRYLAFEHAIYKALHGWKPDADGIAIYDYFTRLSASTEDRQDSYKVRRITFATGYTDRKAQPVHYTIGNPPPLTGG